MRVVPVPPDYVPHGLDGRLFSGVRSDELPATYIVHTEPATAGHAERALTQRFCWSGPSLSVVPPTGFEPALPP